MLGYIYYHGIIDHSGITFKVNYFLILSFSNFWKIPSPPSPLTPAPGCFLNSSKWLFFFNFLKKKYEFWVKIFYSWGKYTPFKLKYNTFKLKYRTFGWKYTTFGEFFKKLSCWIFEKKKNWKKDMNSCRKQISI